MCPSAPPPPPPPPPPIRAQVPSPIPVPLSGPPGPPPRRCCAAVSPPPALVGCGGNRRTSEAKALLARTVRPGWSSRISLPQVALPLRWSRPRFPVTTMLAMGHKIAEHLTRPGRQSRATMHPSGEQKSNPLWAGWLVFRDSPCLWDSWRGFCARVLIGSFFSHLRCRPWRHFDPLPGLNSIFGWQRSAGETRVASPRRTNRGRQISAVLDEVETTVGKPAKQERDSGCEETEGHDASWLP